MLVDRLEISTAFENQVAYLLHWVKLLRESLGGGVPAAGLGVTSGGAGGSGGRTSGRDLCSGVNGGCRVRIRSKLMAA